MKKRPLAALTAANAMLTVEKGGSGELAERFIDSLEKHLIKLGALPLRSRNEWIALRPKYSVEVGMK